MKRLGVRLTVVVLTLAAALVPALATPTQVLTFPETLHASARATGPARTTLDFPATHVAFSWAGTEGTGVRFRTLGGPDGRSPWQRAPESHDLETGDRHFSGVLAVARTARIQWEPVSRRGAYFTTPVTMDYLNTLDGPPRTVEVPSVAQAAASTPTIVTRAQWGADESIKSVSGSCTRRFFPVQQLFVHHTAGSNLDTDPMGTMRAIYWYHTVRRGWCDVGYNFVIGPDGTIFEGRWARSYKPWEIHTSETRKGYAVAGAHVASYNSGSVGISMMGNFSQMELPPPARRSLAELLAWEADRHNLNPTGSHTYRNPETGLTRSLPYIAGHRDAGYTECPGNLLYRRLGGVRRDTAAVIGAGKTATSVSLQAEPPSVAYGDSVVLSGALGDETGAPQAGRPVTIYGRDASGVWTVAAEATTGLDGSFVTTVTPETNAHYVAFFGGDVTMWGSQSAVVPINVRPMVTISSEGGIPDPLSGGSHYPAGTERVFLSGAVTPNHPGARVIVAVFESTLGGPTLLVKKRLRLSAASSYRYGFPVPEPRRAQRFETETRFIPDGDHAWSVSPRIAFTIDP